MDTAAIEKMAYGKLGEIVDPETGLDVLAMGIVKRLSAESDGTVRLLFVPASPACPLAFRIALDIRDAVRSVPGVTRVDIDIDGYWRGEELKRVLEEEGG
jgi:metal-sulfur cluster biosynthetic enzyme